MRQSNYVFTVCKNLSTLFRLPDRCSVFQAEVTAIKVTVDVLLRSVSSLRELCVHSDNRAAILALSSVIVRIKLVKEYITSLAISLSFFCIRLIWVPGHRVIAGNCKADQFAREAFLSHLHRFGNGLGLRCPVNFSAEPKNFM